jgi:hypothetical protein
VGAQLEAPVVKGKAGMNSQQVGPLVMNGKELSGDPIELPSVVDFANDLAQ